MKSKFESDLYVFCGKKYTFISGLKYRFLKFHIRFIYYGRKSAECKIPILKSYYKIRRGILRRKYGLEIYFDHIGYGFRIVHGFNIAISSKAILGNNVVVFKGVTIGEEFRGLRKGAPLIGNRVWIGPNATIVGNIKIGNNVLIAPNSFINFDVPDNSIVIGNPGRILYNEHATDEYLIHMWEEKI